MRISWTLFAFAAALIGCGEGKSVPAPPMPTPAPAPKTDASPPPPRDGKTVDSPASGAGVLSGTVKIKGEIPRPRKVRMDEKPECAALHATPPIDDTLLADKEGNVQWAFVYVKKGAEGKKGPEPPKAVIDQVGCVYKPHVLGVVTGQEIEIRNSDDFLHNIHALPMTGNKEFNIGQSQKGMKDTRTFTQHEIMVKVKCDIHGWMGAWVGVLEHSFFAVTDAKGRFEIKGLPPGKYTIEAWHERYLPVLKDVEMTEKAVLDFELTEQKK